MPNTVIIPLDFPSKTAALAFLARFPQAQKPFVKVGMELFYAEGQSFVRELKALGHKVFLDLKLHDIPNTVRSTMRVLRELEVDITNVHAAGTRAMMAAALEGLTHGNGTRHTQLVAVTQLTSTNEAQLQSELLIHTPMEQTVLHYAQNAQAAGLGGVVCSPLEAAAVKAACGEAFVTITPGIRFAESEQGDQSRIATPQNASGMGCDYLVMGRPILQAADPVAAYRRASAGQA